MQTFKTDLLFYTMMGIIIGTFSENIEDLTNIPERIVLIIAAIIAGIPVFFIIKDWLKKK
jgi:ABC-type Na+ efflux pump permease subunit